MTLKKGTRGNDTLTGTATVDFIFGYLGNDTLNGLAGIDHLFGGAGNDRLSGGAGNDHLDGGFGADTIDGGDGNDIIDTGGGLTFSGSYGDDNAVDKVNAGAGDDYVSINHNDVALGGAGTDQLNVGTPAYGTTISVNVNFSVIGSSTAKAIGAAGSYYANTKAGQFESVNFYVSAADPGAKVIGSSGDDDLNVSMSYSAPAGSKGAAISGGAGDDVISGSSFADTLKGDAGNDQITGGGGHDIETGGAGIDIFLFDLGYGLSSDNSVKITDFNVRDDVISFSASTSTADFGDESHLLLKGANPTNATTAAGVAQVLYSTTTGVLSVDTNGSTAGGVIEIATLSNKPALTAADISIEYNAIVVA